MSRRKLFQVVSTAAATPAATARSRPVEGPAGTLVPAYFHPEVAPGDWRRLADPRPHSVVLNIASGPGETPDPVFQRSVHAVRSAGGTVTAYVDVAYARRDPALVIEDLRRYRAWYGVRDVFFDQAPATPDALPYLRALTETARASGAALLVLNHGTHPDPGYLSLADVLITFEGPASAYLSLTPPPWTRAHPRHRFCHLVHTCPPGTLTRILTRARGQAGLLYVTDRLLPNPYDRLPPHFPRLLPARAP